MKFNELVESVITESEVKSWSHSGFTIPKEIIALQKKGVIEDISYGNDEAPSFAIQGSSEDDSMPEFKIWIDAEDKSMRQVEDAPRFALSKIDFGTDTYDDYLVTDDLKELVKTIKKFAK